MAIPLLVGGLSALITSGAMSDFEAINKPPLSPPGWLFPVVWSVLFILMGIASYLVLTSYAPQDLISRAIKIYAFQLILNFFWSIIFFNLKAYYFAFVWLVVLWLAILFTTSIFYKIRKAAGYLLIPYLLWVTFAGYLNFSIAIMN